ncbi:alanine dehydrogenase [Levilactobacillus hammesii]|nr:alanine dehydrogenase [Levilactobacillus hammesii]
MKVGIPREIKNNENRVGITPAGVVSLVHAGHQVLVEAHAGEAAGYPDAVYQEAGATLCDAAAAWACDLVIKVKEPIASEYHFFHEGLILYTYLHLAPDRQLTEALLDAKVTGVAYETMVGAHGGLPLLVPMSEVAGRMAVQLGAHFLEENNGGKGVLLAGVPGVAKGNVVVIGGGTVGFNAAKIALGLGAHVTLLDINAARLAEIDDLFSGAVQTLISNPFNLAQAVQQADLVIGAVLIPGHTAPKLVSEAMIQSMEPGSVVVDIPVDQGGIFATTDHATTHDDPIFVKDGVVHYAVANIPGAVPKTATAALTNVTIPYAVLIANLGIAAAARQNKTILTGINTYAGQLTEAAVAASQGVSAQDFLSLV